MPSRVRSVYRSTVTAPGTPVSALALDRPLVGSRTVDPGGGVVGTTVSVAVDPWTYSPRWLVIRMLERCYRHVPAILAWPLVDDVIQLPWTGEQLLAAPSRGETILTVEAAETLGAYYGSLTL